MERCKDCGFHAGYHSDDCGPRAPQAPPARPTSTTSSHKRPQAPPAGSTSTTSGKRAFVVEAYRYGGRCIARRRVVRATMAARVAYEYIVDLGPDWIAIWDTHSLVLPEKPGFQRGFSQAAYWRPTGWTKIDDVALAAALKKEAVASIAKSWRESQPMNQDD